MLPAFPVVRRTGAAIADNWSLDRRRLAGTVFPYGPVSDQRWYSNAMSESMTAEAYAAYRAAFADADLSTIYRRVPAPTLLWVPKEGSARESSLALASLMPNCRVASTPDPVDAVTAMLEFMDISAAPKETPLMEHPALPLGGLRTILFTDIVGHTEMMQRLGDTKGRDVLREHEHITRDLLKQHGGAEVKTMGDGFMASFSSVTSRPRLRHRPPARLRRPSDEGASRCTSASASTPASPSKKTATSSAPPSSSPPASPPTPAPARSSSPTPSAASSPAKPSSSPTAANSSPRASTTPSASTKSTGSKADAEPRASRSRIIPACSPISATQRPPTASASPTGRWGEGRPLFVSSPLTFAHAGLEPRIPAIAAFYERIASGRHARTVGSAQLRHVAARRRTPGDRGLGSRRHRRRRQPPPRRLRSPRHQLRTSRSCTGCPATLPDTASRAAWARRRYGSLTSSPTTNQAADPLARRHELADVHGDARAFPAGLAARRGSPLRPLHPRKHRPGRTTWQSWLPGASGMRRRICRLVSCPTLVVSGGDNAKHARAYAAAIPGARFLDMGAGQRQLHRRHPVLARPHHR